MALRRRCARGEDDAGHAAAHNGGDGRRAMPSARSRWVDRGGGLRTSSAS
jgi:hypothetical protein